MKTETWNASDNYRYFLGQLPSESFGDGRAYELIRIDRGSNLQRGKAILDLRFSRQVRDENAILPEAMANCPRNIRRILRRFCRAREGGAA